jgi:hypothetical protein
MFLFRSEKNGLLVTWRGPKGLVIIISQSDGYKSQKGHKRKIIRVPNFYRANPKKITRKQSDPPSQLW